MAASTAQMDQLIETVRTLRERCAWTQALTHESLRTYLIEESYEVLDAIAAQDPDLLREELGDLFFQILLHALIAEEAQAFTLEDIAATLNAKLLRRNRHVFDDSGRVRQDIIVDIDEIIRVWDAAKQAERAEQTKTKTNAGLPTGLPALTLAQKLLDRHTRAGSVSASHHRELADLANQVTDEQGLGAALMALTARAEELHLDAESVLRDVLRRNYVGTTNETTSPETHFKR